MRLGLIVRGVTRGLGIQSYEAWRHLNPTVTVLIDSTPDQDRWTLHPEWYPDAVITPWAGYTAPISDEAMDALLTCDVLLTFETWYDPSIPEKARAKGIGTVIMVNPELWREHETDDVTAVWVATPWRIEHLPRAELVPMPVALDRLPFNPGEGFLHLGGHKARADRNGMEAAIRSARHSGIPLTVTSQDDLPPFNRGVTFAPARDNYWEMYEGFGVLVMPRKYGGLCLPVQEALAAGLAVVMTDCDPNREWPVALVPSVRGQKIKMVGGTIQLWEVHRTELSAEMTRMLDADYRREFQERGREWAVAHSWESLLPWWTARLNALC